MRNMKRIVKDIMYRAGLAPAKNTLHQLLQSRQWSSRGEHPRSANASSLPPLHCVIGWGKSEKSQARLFAKVCKQARISYNGETFVYSPDFGLIRLYRSTPESIEIGNIPLDISPLLDNGVLKIEEKLQQLQSKPYGTSSNCALYIVCRGLKIYWQRCRECVLDYIRVHPDEEGARGALRVLDDSLMRPSKGLNGALQAILTINALLWTNGMRLVGLGRLDQVLEPYYRRDMESGVLTDEKCLELIKEFLTALHRDYYWKSNSLPGDTGQVITLSGVNSQGQDCSNSLTRLFLLAVTELRLPDPKVVVRVHATTPDSIWEASVKCMCTGIGSPLLSNDERVIKALEKFGYTKADAAQYATSACWEPCIPGVSTDQNNVGTINFMLPLQKLIVSIELSKESVPSFALFKDYYLRNLGTYVRGLAAELAIRKCAVNPFLSLLIQDCLLKGKDISEGGARYNNLGMTGVAFGNTVNALLNIRRLVYEERRIRESDLAGIVRENLGNDDFLISDLLTRGEKYCTNSDAALVLSNELIDSVANELRGIVTPAGVRIRFGVSSPSHIESGCRFPASFDGRRENQPFGVHISPCGGGMPVSPLEVGAFASGLHYEEAFNGGVVDLVIERRQMEGNVKKFTALFQTCVAKGMFQCQTNLVDLAMLKDARLHPDRYPQLIVRVWGFSAYFRDLPSEYQDLLIRRAEQAHAAGF